MVAFVKMFFLQRTLFFFEIWAFFLFIPWKKWYNSYEKGLVPFEPFSIIIKDKVAWSSSFVRLILIPLISLCILKFIPDDLYLIKMTVLIAASTPVGSNVAIFAQLNGQDYTQAIKSICLSTVCSLITMPFIITLAMMIW